MIKSYHVENVDKLQPGENHNSNIDWGKDVICMLMHDHDSATGELSRAVQATMSPENRCCSPDTVTFANSSAGA
jgi:hypothetical protein